MIRSRASGPAVNLAVVFMLNSLFAVAAAAQGITVVNMIPNLNCGETNQDSEPNLAVNPANPLQIAGSAFTPDPMQGPNAPIYVSTDGGNTWAFNMIVPSQAGPGHGVEGDRAAPKTSSTDGHGT